MFKPGQKVICIDAAGSDIYDRPGFNMLKYKKEYIVDHYDYHFVTLEGVRGDWHESRFILIEDEENE